jgi:hypothetical protein
MPLGMAWAQQSDAKPQGQSNKGAYWDLGLSAGFVAVGAVAIVQAGNAANERDAAEQLGQEYAYQFGQLYTLTIQYYTLYLEDLDYHGGTSAAALYALYVSYAAQADYYGELTGEQADIVDDKNKEEGVWKGVAYASFAAAAVFLVKGFIGIATSESRVVESAGIGVVSEVFPNPRLGMTVAF